MLYKGILDILMKIHRSVTSIIAEFLPVTIITGGFALSSVQLEFLLESGWLFSENKKSFNELCFADVLGTGISNFVLALVLIFVFGVKFHWLPVLGDPMGILYSSVVLLQFIRLLLFAGENDCPSIQRK